LALSSQKFRELLGQQSFIETVGRFQWSVLFGLAKMKWCICLFFAGCLGPVATMLSGWDLESGGLFGVEKGSSSGGMESVPSQRFASIAHCPSGVSIQ